MRSTAMQQTMRFGTMAAVVVSLTVAAAYSQQRTRSTPRSRDQQQGQMMSSQMGEPDFFQRMAERNERRRLEMQEEMEEMRRWAQESRNRAIQQALRATDEQWRRIKPRLDQIERLKAEANVAADLGSGPGSGSFQSQTFTFGDGSGGASGSGGIMMGGGMGSGAGGGMGGGMGGMGGGASTGPMGNRGGTWTSGPKSLMEMSEGEILCEEIQHLLQGESVPAAEIAQKVAALRRIRAQARDDLARARIELRTLMLPHQEPALVVMGYLD